MQQLNEGIIPMGANLLQMKSQAARVSTQYSTGIQSPVHQDNTFLQSIAGEIYLAIIEETIEEDFITRLNGIINRYRKEVMDSNLPAMVGFGTATVEINEKPYAKRNRDIAINTLNQRLNSVL